MRSSKENVQGFGKTGLSLFIDANTIVSGLLFSGNEALLLKLGAAGACRLLTTEQVMGEVAQTLRAEEFKFSAEEAAALLSSAYRAVQVHANVRESELENRYDRLNDKKDVHVLAAFETLKCDMLATGDKELLAKVSAAKTTRKTLEAALQGTRLDPRDCLSSRRFGPR